MEELLNKIKYIETQIETLKKNWPAHSVSTTLMDTLDELEEALEKAKAELASLDESGETTK